MKCVRLGKEGDCRASGESVSGKSKVHIQMETLNCQLGSKPGAGEEVRESGFICKFGIHEHINGI